MKISEITKQDVLNFMRADDDGTNSIEIFMSSAKQFIIGYTGLTTEQLEGYEDLTTAYLVIIADMYDNRNYVDNKSVNINPLVEQLLSLHCRNFLPKVAST